MESAVSKVSEAVKETKAELLKKQRAVRPTLAGVTDRTAGGAVNPSTGTVPAAPSATAADSESPFNFKRGGRVKKTGIYRMHKGEFVVPAEVVQRVDQSRKTSRKSGRR
jgi:hypothetical protein